MANLFNLLRKKKLDQYNQAMRSSPAIDPYLASKVEFSRREAEAKRAQMLLADESSLTTDQLGGGAFGAWKNESEYTYDRGSNEYRYSPLGARYEAADESGKPRQVVEAPMIGTDTIYKDRKDGKGQDFEGMMEALEKHQSAGPAGWASMGKPGGTGGGGFKLFPNSMVDDMASSGPLNLEQQKEDWWKRYLRSIA
jgi:hypothetical protein